MVFYYFLHYLEQMRDSPRIFIETDLFQSGNFELNRDQTHYLLNVLRKGIGDEVIVFNGRDGEFCAKIENIGKKSTNLVTVSKIRDQNELPNLTLLFSPIKGHRNDNIVEKATEIGTKCLFPIICERTIVRNANIEKYRANAIEAAEQCEGLNVPQILPASHLFDAINNIDCDLILFADETGGGKAIGDIIDQNIKSIALLIGPEGGFSNQERQKLLQYEKVKAFSLGPRILRADTAAITGLALIQSNWGDWYSKTV